MANALASASASASGFWERVRASHRRRGAFLLAVAALLLAPLALIPNPDEAPLADFERLAFDASMRVLRSIHPRPVADDIVLVGINEDTEEAFADEPTALWHEHYAAALHALARVKPRAVGVDVVLPDRSYDRIKPRIDIAMMRGIADIRRASALVYVQTVNNRGQLVPVQPNFRGVLGPENLGVDQQLRDPDSVSRVFSERLLSRTPAPVPTLAGQILRALGKPVDEGYIDYSLGAPIEYVPLHQLIAWSDDVPRLEKLFAGRIVLIGSLSKVTDRWRLPVTLLANDPAAAAGNLKLNQPGVLVHLQALRSQLATGLLHPLPEPVRWSLVGAMLLFVFLRAPPGAVVVCAIVVPIAIAAAGLVTIVAAQTLLPVASLVLAFWLAITARAVFDAVSAVVERLRLQQSFAGQVSPAVMREMLGGGLRPGVSGQPAEVCVLFSDIRDFTTLSEHMPADVVITLLQRYFDRMVRPVHRFNGAVDKFIGDGMMVLFGAPVKSADPCGEAVQCALAMMAELDQLNVEFAREGLPTIVIGIGINYGSATVGNIGSSERHNYSAIGDAVNVAARVEGLTKELRRKIIITEAVVSRIEKERFHFDPLGAHNVKGHSPVKVWGIRTTHVAPPVKQEAEAVQ